MRGVVLGALVLSLIELASGPAQAGDGDLDPSFGVAGVVITDVTGRGLQDDAFALAIQPDGGILVAGSTGPFLQSSCALAIRPKVSWTRPSGLVGW